MKMITHKIIIINTIRKEMDHLEMFILLMKINVIQWVDVVTDKIIIEKIK